MALRLRLRALNEIKHIPDDFEDNIEMGIQKAIISKQFIRLAPLVLSNTNKLVAIVTDLCNVRKLSNHS